jgi:hypothetical protein
MRRWHAEINLPGSFACVIAATCGSLEDHFSTPVPGRRL